MRHRQRRGSARAKAPDRRTPVAVTSIGEGELSMHGTSWVRVLQAKPLRSLRRGAEHLATYLLLAEFSFRRRTFGMSCGWKQVKPAGRRQLDGRVRHRLWHGIARGSATHLPAESDLLQAPQTQSCPRGNLQTCLLSALPDTRQLFLSRLRTGHRAFQHDSFQEMPRQLRSGLDLSDSVTPERATRG